VAIAPQKSYVNLMFSKGVELLDLDSTHLLEGTGKKARHSNSTIASVSQTLVFRPSSRRLPSGRGTPNHSSLRQLRQQKSPATQGFREADDGTRTHDPLHGNASSGSRPFAPVREQERAR
jgi:hypothetical protein